MNIKSFYKYQLHNYIHSLLWYYIVLQSVIFMFLRLVLLGHNVQGNGIGMSALIFLFLCGQYFFKKDFYFGLQNGVSRKTMMVSLGLTNMTVATGMAIIDVILLGGLFGMGVSLNSVSDKIFLGVGNISFFGLLYQTSLNIMITMLSSFIAIVCYRIKKSIRFGLGLGILIPLFIVFPTLDLMFAKGTAMRFLSSLLTLIFGLGIERREVHTYLFIGFLAVSGVLLLLSWVLLKRTPMKD
ncbi:MAG: hypothetical protein RSD97_00460 [Lachnospiraceae bacterium]